MEEKIKALKEKLEKFDTLDLLGMISTRFLVFGQNGADIARQSDVFAKTELMSSQRQLIYLAGLLVSTEYKSNGNEPAKGEKWFEKIENDVQNITFDYMKNFFEAAMGAEEKTAHQSMVSMEAFASYFDMGILRYPEQTIELMKKLYSDFDSELLQLTGLELEEYISFYQLVYDEANKSINTTAKVREEIETFLQSLDPNSPNIKAEYAKMLEFGQGEAREKLRNAAENINIITYVRIAEVFGEAKAKLLLDRFSLQREKRIFLFYNGDNPFEEKPLCKIEDGAKLFIVHPNFVLNAIYAYITEVLEKNTNTFADKYRKKKAEVVEELFCDLLEKILGSKAKIHRSVCEECGTKEHDILVEFEDYILIAEAKASKVREPFFNPEKSFRRIKDHFDSDAGIGGAYEQAILLKKFIEPNDEIELFENKIKKFKIADVHNKKILPLVLTLNQFGDIAVNTTELLNKEDGQPYPWVCNWHDLDNINEVLSCLNKEPKDFIEYITWRIENHEKVMASDELDVFEAFMMHKIPVAKNTMLFFAPDGPSLVDKVYFEKHGIPYDFPIKAESIRRKQKIGRNEPCPCGSGYKFKKCCLGKGIYD